MATSSKIRVGIVGASASRGFASVAHMPALRALPQFEIVAVCTASQETAQAAARHYGAALAFSDAQELAQHSDIDLVTVSVKVPDHLLAGHGGNRRQKACLLRVAARPQPRGSGRKCSMRPNARGIRHAVGCKARCRRRSTTSKT